MSGNLRWICKWISRLSSSMMEGNSHKFRWNKPMCFGKILVGYWSLQFIWVDFPFQPTTLVPPPFWHLLASRGYHFRSVFFLEAKKVLQFFSLSTKYVVPSIFWKKMFYQNYFLGFEAKNKSNWNIVWTCMNFSVAQIFHEINFGTSK